MFGDVGDDDLSMFELNLPNETPPIFFCPTRHEKIGVVEYRDAGGGSDVVDDADEALGRRRALDEKIIGVHARGGELLIDELTFEVEQNVKQIVNAFRIVEVIEHGLALGAVEIDHALEHEAAPAVGIDLAVILGEQRHGVDALAERPTISHLAIEILIGDRVEEFDAAPLVVGVNEHFLMIAATEKEVVGENELIGHDDLRY